MSKMTKNLIVLIFSINFQCFSAIFTDSYIDMQFMLGPFSEQCYQSIIGDQISTLFFKFRSRENPSNIDVIIIEPDESLHFRNFSDFSFPIKAPGTYEICIKNQYSSEVKINYRMWTTEIQNMFELVKISSSSLKMFGEFEKLTSSISRKLSVFQTGLENRKYFEKIDRSNAEDNFVRVNNCGLIFTIVLVFSSIIQVVFIRALFTENSRIGAFFRRKQVDHYY